MLDVLKDGHWAICAGRSETCYRETQGGFEFANVATPRIYGVPRYTATSGLDPVRRAIGLQDQFGKLAR